MFALSRYRRALDVVNVRSAGPIAGGERAWSISVRAIVAGSKRFREKIASGLDGGPRSAQRHMGAVDFACSGWDFPAGNVLSSAKYRLALHAHGDQREE